MSIHQVIRKGRLTGLILAVAAGVATGICAGELPLPNARSNAGKALYARFGCFECHGYAGQGSIMSGPPLAGRALPASYVKVYARAPQGIMPSYREAILSDKDLDEIATFVSTLPAGRSASEIPELARFQSEGRKPRDQRRSSTTTLPQH
jgi:ubiquinol-cytochrome c reductase cytochrome c subunit